MSQRDETYSAGASSAIKVEPVSCTKPHAQVERASGLDDGRGGERELCRLHETTQGCGWRPRREATKARRERAEQRRWSSLPTRVQLHKHDIGSSWSRGAVCTTTWRCAGAPQERGNQDEPERPNLGASLHRPRAAVNAQCGVATIHATQGPQPTGRGAGCGVRACNGRRGGCA